MWVNFSGLQLPHEKLSEKLIHEARLAFNDGKAFGTAGDNFMRINLACPRSTVETAMQRLAETFNSH